MSGAAPVGVPHRLIPHNLFVQFEPTIDKVGLLDALRAAYRIEADALEFVPVGFAAACYTVAFASRPVGFVKLYPFTATERAGPDLTVILPLPYGSGEGRRG